MMGNEREKKHEQAREQEGPQGKQLVDENESAMEEPSCESCFRVSAATMELYWSIFPKSILVVR